MRWLRALALAAAVLCGCAESPTDEVIEQAARPSPEPAPEGMSYEVAIAIAAADRNRAFEQCAARPAAERPRCRTQVQAEWDAARAALEDLRGDQG
jgi:ABC-type uncharacterized transport system auxiliary subunit